MLDKLRNIGIIAHVDAGKTTTTERILLLSGTKHKAGEVDQGTTTTDSDVAEQRMGITINSAAVTIEWGDTNITLIDTPGHVDFTAEVQRSLRVLDGAIGVFCAVGGVEVQSEKVWFQANEYNVPRIAFVNKLDRMGADFFACVQQMKDKLQVVPAICALPVGQHDQFQGVIDLVEMKFILRASNPTWMNKRYSLVDIPAAHKQQAEKYRHALLEAGSHFDDQIVERILADRPVSGEMLQAALRKGTLAGAVTPILCGSAMRYQGVELLLDAVVHYLPSPADRGTIHGAVYRSQEQAQRRPDPQEPFAGLAFKTVSDPNGDMVYVRIYSGELRQGQAVLNTTTGQRERVARIRRMMGARGKDVDSAGPGEIVALVGLKTTFTGNTLCAEDSPVVLEEIRFPDPVIAQALVPDKCTDETRLAESLAKLVRDDPTLKFRTDPETKQLILAGMGELHLAISVEKLMRTPDVVVTAGKPIVAYRQTLSRAVEVETRYIKQSGGGRGRFAVIRCSFEALGKEQAEEVAESLAAQQEKPDPHGLYFTDAVVGGAVPRKFIPAVEEGFRAACQKGIRFGLPCMRMRCTLLDGDFHEVDSSPEAFRLAAMECTREAQTRAGITLLEPIMKVVVTAPEKQQGQLAGDVNRRRGEIHNFTSDKGRCQIHAFIPLAELFGYAGELRNATSGTASFTMEPSHYAPVKEELADVRQRE